jgi:hypothetical protein
MTLVSEEQVLQQFADGKIDRREAVDLLQLRDYAKLLIGLGAAGLALPQLLACEIKSQVDRFVSIMNGSP